MTDLPIPESWDVVIIGGGEVHRWRWGTLSQNPWWFIAGVVLIFAGEVFVVWSIFSVEMSRWRSKTMGDDR